MLSSLRPWFRKWAAIDWHAGRMTQDTFMSRVRAFNAPPEDFHEEEFVAWARFTPPILVHPMTEDLRRRLAAAGARRVFRTCMWSVYPATLASVLEPSDRVTVSAAERGCALVRGFSEEPDCAPGEPLFPSQEVLAAGRAAFARIVVERVQADRARQGAPAIGTDLTAPAANPIVNPIVNPSGAPGGAAGSGPASDPDAPLPPSEWC